MRMESIITKDYAGWQRVKHIYTEAFGPTAKPQWVIRNMFEKGMCHLHIIEQNGEPAGFALAGVLKETRLLLIDYLAVFPEERGKGFGSALVQSAVDWAESCGYDGVVIEADADESRTLAFWENSGFHSTGYIHHYKWVPEPYRLFYKEIKPATVSEICPETLFAYIGRFHGDSFKKQKN